LTRVFYSDSGSTAVEVALKLALQYWQQQSDTTRRGRTRYLALRGSYHGDTVGAVSVGGIAMFHQRFAPLLFPALHGPGGRPGDVCWHEHAVAEVVTLIHQHGAELAAVIVEPGMQGAAGMHPLPRGLLRALRSACDAVGTLLIADEVAMGLGRTGQRFACDLEQVAPDLLCLAKGLTGGYLPLAATLASERIYEAFLGPPELGRTFFHGHTYTGNALACAAALAALDLLERELPLLAERVAALQSGLAALAALPAVAEIRQLGLAAGVELVSDRARRMPYPASERRGMRVAAAAQRRGVFLRPLGDVMVLMPALTFTTAELTRLTSVLGAAIAEVCADAV
jgi:adenosylmethionine-8-amino-7-oxononanoate aminotransferase